MTAKPRSCELCNSSRLIEEHHISYYPERTMALCKECHDLVHNQDGFRDDLRPDIPRPDDYSSPKSGRTVLKTCTRDGSICELVTKAEGVKRCIFCRRFFNSDGEKIGQKFIEDSEGGGGPE